MSAPKHYVRTFKYLGVPIQAHVIDGKQVIKLQRTHEDVLNGKKRDSELCMNANCMMRLRHLFPHKVLAVWFCRTAAYALKTAVRNKYTVVRYVHGEGQDVDDFDNGIDVDPVRTFSLRPASGHDRIGFGDWRKYEHGDHKARPKTFAHRGQDARFRSIRQYEEMRALKQTKNEGAPAPLPAGSGRA